MLVLVVLGRCADTLGRMLQFLVLILTYFLTLMLTGYARRYVLKANVLDHPNGRSSHTVPTPRGGGLAAVGVLVISLIGLVVWRLLPTEFAVFALATSTIAAVGWSDDRRGLSARIRLAVQFVCSSVVMFLMGRSSLFDGLSGAVFFIAVMLFVVWMVNLYNFMDGIDGILGLQVATVSFSFAVLLLVGGKLEQVFVYASLIGAMLGFLYWNWSPAKIFMGDVGSASLGFLLAALAVWSVVHGELSLISILILHAAFIGDATWTLSVRFARGQKVYQAHRSHFYQKLTQRGISHARVATLFGVFNLVWLLPLAWYAEQRTAYSGLLLLLAYLPVIAVCFFSRAGFEQ